MRPTDIDVGRTYVGGKNGDKRTVLSRGANPDFIEWGEERHRLPLGAFYPTRWSRVASFAKWANREAQKGKGE